MRSPRFDNLRFELVECGEVGEADIEFICQILAHQIVHDMRSQASRESDEVLHTELNTDNCLHHKPQGSRKSNSDDG